MVINWNKNLEETLTEIKGTTNDLPVYISMQFTTKDTKTLDTFRNGYIECNKLQNKIFEMINSIYCTTGKKRFEYKPLQEIQEDDYSYDLNMFLHEASDNIIRYSENEIPKAFHLWTAEKGFVIGVEQEGNGFNAKKINESRICDEDSKGRGFEFFRNSKQEILFDNPIDTRIVYMKYVI